MLSHHSVPALTRNRYYPDYFIHKHARQNFKRKAERYKWDEMRQKLFYPKDDQFKNSE